MAAKKDDFFDKWQNVLLKALTVETVFHRIKFQVAGCCVFFRLQTQTLSVGEKFSLKTNENQEPTSEWHENKPFFFLTFVGGFLFLHVFY